MNWKMRAFRVLPMFLLPALSTLAYTTFLSFTRMCKFLLDFLLLAFLHRVFIFLHSLDVFGGSV